MNKEVDTKELLKSFNELNDSLKEIRINISNINKSLDKISVQKASKEIGSLKKSVLQTSNSMGELFYIFQNESVSQTFLTAIKGIKRGMEQLSDIMDIFEIKSKIEKSLKDIIGSFIDFVKNINPIIVLIGAIIVGLGYIYSTNEQVRESISNIAEMFLINLKPLLEFISNTVLPNLKDSWCELIYIMEPFTDFLTEVFTYIWEEQIIPLFQWLSEEVLSNMSGTFENLWNNILVPLGEYLKVALAPAIEKISDIFETLWENVIVPISEFLITTFKNSWESLYEILNKVVIPIIGNLIAVFNFLWKNVLQPIIDFLYSIFKEKFEKVCNSIGEIIGGLKKIFNGIIDFITGIFTLNWEKSLNGVKDTFSGIWETLVVVIRSPLNKALGIIEDFINRIIHGWNFMKRQINKLSLDVPEWLGGGTIGFNLQMSDDISLPRFANGGLPSHGSMFIAGEHGAEIVGHINGRTEVLNRSQIASSIYSAMISAMSQFSGQSSQIDVHVHTDEGTVVDRINQTTKQTGVCPINIPV